MSSFVANWQQSYKKTSSFIFKRHEITIFVEKKVFLYRERYFFRKFAPKLDTGRLNV